MDAEWNPEEATSMEATASPIEAAPMHRMTPIDIAVGPCPACPTGIGEQGLRGQQESISPGISSGSHGRIATWRFLTFTFAITLTLLLSACKPTGTLERFQQAVAHSDTLWACEIDGNPTLPAEHKQGIRYVFDYEVKLVRPLLATEVDVFRKALQDSTTFDKVNVKSCPMVAKWAIAVRNRGKFPAAMVISPAPCSKALIFDKKHPDKPLNLELREGNRVEELITKLW